MITRCRKQHATVLMLGFALANVAGAAGLSEVKQTIFGMDCAPCAHGVEKGLSKIDGVEDVSVSLNDGYALVRLAPDNAVGLDEIRRVIRENGFTPKEATVVVSGTLTRADDELILTSSANQEFRLAASPEAQSAWQDLQSRPDGSTVTVQALVISDEISRLSVLVYPLAARPVSD